MVVSAGVTRESIIQLARKLGYEVLEEPVSIHEAMEADEVFTTGQQHVHSWHSAPLPFSRLAWRHSP